jgi:hypothetical protein
MDRKRFKGFLPCEYNKFQFYSMNYESESFIPRGGIKITIVLVIS